MTHAYDASHMKDSGSGVDDSGEPELPTPPHEELSDGAGVRLEERIDGEWFYCLYNEDGDCVVLSKDAAQKLLAYVEKWK